MPFELNVLNFPQMYILPLYIFLQIIFLLMMIAVTSDLDILRKTLLIFIKLNKAKLHVFSIMTTKLQSYMCALNTVPKYNSVVNKEPRQNVSKLDCGFQYFLFMLTLNSPNPYKRTSNRLLLEYLLRDGA